MFSSRRNFKAGMGVGIFIVIAIPAVILFINTWKTTYKTPVKHLLQEFLK
jgi:hypothetical protein